MAKKRLYDNKLAHRLNTYFADHTHGQIAREIGENAETVRRWRKHGNVPARFLAKIAKHYDVNPNWLLTGDGAMNKQDEAEAILRSMSTQEIMAELARRVAWRTDGPGVNIVDGVRIFRHSTVVRKRIRARASANHDIRPRDTDPT